MSAHTPGPWVAECDPSHFNTLSTVVAGARRKLKGICRQMIVQVGGWADWREQEANTRLIASAPDLLHVVQWVRDCESLRRENGESGLHDDLVSAIDAAIAKAEGR